MKNSKISPKLFVLYFKDGKREVKMHVAYIKANSLADAKSKLNFNSKYHIIRERVI